MIIFLSSPNIQAEWSYEYKNRNCHVLPMKKCTVLQNLKKSYNLFII